MQSKAIGVILLVYVIGLAAMLFMYVEKPAQPDRLEELTRTYKIHLDMMEAEIAALQAPDRARVTRYIQSVNPHVSLATAELITQGIFKAAEEYSLPYKVLLGLIEVESTFRFNAVSPAQAVGLTQVHVPTWLETENPRYNLIHKGMLQSQQCLYDPITNIMAGGYILNWYYRAAVRTGHNDPMRRALTRYYGGNVNGHYDRVTRAIGRFIINS